jgi:hypothetical protein
MKRSEGAVWLVTHGGKVSARSFNITIFDIQKFAQSLLQIRVATGSAARRLVSSRQQCRQWHLFLVRCGPNLGSQHRLSDSHGAPERAPANRTVFASGGGVAQSNGSIYRKTSGGASRTIAGKQAHNMVLNPANANQVWAHVENGKLSCSSDGGLTYGDVLHRPGPPRTFPIWSGPKKVICRTAARSMI